MKYDTYQEKKNDDTITAIIAIGNLKNEAKYLKVAELKSEIRCDACLVLFVYLLSLPLRQLLCSHSKQRNKAACGGDTPGPSNGARTRTVKDHSFAVSVFLGFISYSDEKPGPFRLNQR